MTAGRATVLLNFCEGAEHRTLTAGALVQALWLPDHEPPDHRPAILRPPSTACLTRATSRLGPKPRARGIALNDVAAAFAGAAEFQGRYGSLSNWEFLEQIYYASLSR